MLWATATVWFESYLYQWKYITESNKYTPILLTTSGPNILLVAPLATTEFLKISRLSAIYKNLWEDGQANMLNTHVMVL